jgi:hypothetical protein
LHAIHWLPLTSDAAVRSQLHLLLYLCLLLLLVVRIGREERVWELLRLEV